MEHGLFADSRCSICEDDFTRRYLKAKAVAAGAALFAYAVLLGALDLTGLLWKVLAVPYSGLGLFLLVLGMISLGVWTARAVVRRAFLRERLAPAPLVHARA